MLGTPARMRTSVPLDAQNNLQAFCMEVVEFFWRDGCTQSITHMHIAGWLVGWHRGHTWTSSTYEMF